MLSTTQQKFISHFGEMGSRWGINRTVGQIYALLYVSREPLCADDIAEYLSISRSNVSMGLKELDGWRLTRVKHFPGDRKDYFTVPDDIWEIVRTLAEERSKREIDPTLSMLRSALLEAPQNGEDSYVRTRMQEMHDLIEMFTQWHSDMQKMETAKLVKLLKMGEKIYQLYEMKNKLKIIPGGRKAAKSKKGEHECNG